MVEGDGAGEALRGQSQRMGGGRQSDGGEEWNGDDQHASFDPNQFGEGAGKGLGQNYQITDTGISSPAVPGNIHRANMLELS